MEDTDVDTLAALGNQILGILDDDDVIVTLQNGKVVEGSPASFMLKKKTKKGESSWSGSFSVETDTGVLEMNCSNIASVKSG